MAQLFDLRIGQRFRFINCWWTVTEHHRYQVKAELVSDSTARAEFISDRTVEAEQLEELV